MVVLFVMYDVNLIFGWVDCIFYIVGGWFLFGILDEVL